MFVRAKDGSIVNLAHVVRLYPAQDGDGTAKAVAQIHYGQGGMRATLFEGTFKEVDEFIDRTLLESEIVVMGDR